MVRIILKERIRTMNTKLTLKMDETVIEAAKIFAREHRISISKLTETYLKKITGGSQSYPEMTGVVGELAGILKGMDIDKSDYTDYLENKYL